MKKRTVVLLSLGTALILGAVVASYFTIGGDGDGVVATNGELVITDGPSRDVLPQDDDPPDALFGYNPDPQATRQFLRELPAPTIREAGPGLFQARGPPEDVFLYRALYKAHQDRFQRDYVVVKQGIGDCVGHGFANGCDVHLAVMWSLGDSAEWWPSSSESVYGGSRVQARGVSNGGWSDGSYGSAAAKFLRDWGIGFRKDYGDGIDLTVYSAKRAKDWGYYGAGGQGQPSFFIDDVKKHPVRSVALVTTFDEAAAAIQSGYPIPVCSMVGFTSTRDGQGFARASGTWAHCLMPGTIVGTYPPKKCEDVEVGDLVVTHEGNLKPVEEVITRGYKGTIVNLRVTGTLDVSATSEHPILVYRKMHQHAYPDVDLLYYGGGKLQYLNDPKLKHDESQPKWMPINQVQKGDYLLIPKGIPRAPAYTQEWVTSPRGKTLPPLVPDKDIAYFIGNYVADGSSVAAHRVTITTPPGAAYQSKLAAGCKKLGLEYHIKECGTYDRFVVYSSTLANSLMAWCGKSSGTKQVPDFIFSEGWCWESFMDGYCDGDGTTLKNGRQRVTTVSPVLANQVWMMTVSLGMYPIMSNIKGDRPGAYENGKDGFSIEFGREPIRKETRYWNGYYCCPVRDVTESEYEGVVYNYEVADDHSYIASGVVHHNCMVFVGARHGDRPGLLCLNSWGPTWINGPKWPDDQPDGSFWVDKATVNRMLAQRDSFVISGYDGFPFRKLDHAAWVEAKPKFWEEVLPSNEPFFALAP